MKLRHKILLMCMSCILSALVLQTYFFQEASSKMIYSMVKEESENSLRNMQSEINSIIQNDESKMMNIYMQGKLIYDLQMKENISDLRKKHSRIVTDLECTYFDSSDWVVAMYLYTDNHEIISAYRRATTPKHKYPQNIYNDLNAYNSKIVKRYIASDETTMLISSYYNKYREKDIIRLVLKIYNSRNIKETLGYLVCDLDTKPFTKIMEKYRTETSAIMWLQPHRDRGFALLGCNSDEEQDYYDWVSQRIHADGKVVNEQADRQELFEVQQEKYNLSAYSLMPKSILLQNQKILTGNLLVIALIMIITTFIISCLISQGLTRQLQTLMHTIQKIKNGDVSLRVSLNCTDEIGELGDNFNEMLDEMEKFRENEKRTQILLEQAKYKALQAQINPHFLYNTLDTMGSIAEIRNCWEVSRLSQALSNVFRYCLNMKDPFSTIGQEIVHLKNYTYIMNMRMQDHIQYEFDISEETLVDKIPRISLQPVVENAINHGLRNKRGEKKICIEIKHIDQILQISIEDNGVGMDATSTNLSLEENDPDLVEQGNSIGLYNINARLKMLYGKEFGVHVDSCLGVGTKVVMTLPKDTKGGEK